MDDYCPKRGIRGEHGLSFYIETEDARLLFDTGQSETFLENARVLRIDLSGLDAVILSHGHYDHGGGLNALYATLDPPLPPLFAGRGFDAPRRSRGVDGLKDIGLPSPLMPLHAPAAIVIDTFKELASGVYFLPQAERLDGIETTSRFWKIQGETELIDDFCDEISLVFNAEDGIVVITGCAHRGILNIARAAAQAFPGKPLKALVGGFHLADESPEAISRIASDIAAMAPSMIICGHCTGLRGFAALSQAVGGKVSWLSCGMSISL